MKDSIENHKHLIKYLTAMKKELVPDALDRCLKLKLINKTMYKQILKEVTMEGIERKNFLDEIDLNKDMKTYDAFKGYDAKRFAPDSSTNEDYDFNKVKVIDGVEYIPNTFELEHMNITEEDLKLAKQMYSGLELEPPNDIVKDFEKEVRETCKEFEPDSEDEEEDEDGN